MTLQRPDLVTWPRDLPGLRRFACEGADSPTGLYPPLDRTGLPRWLWCVVTWTLAAASNRGERKPNQLLHRHRMYLLVARLVPLLLLLNQR